MDKTDKYYLISAWDHTTSKGWQFYSRYKREKFHLSSDVNKAEIYVKKGWAEKCKKRLIKYYTEGNLFPSIKAEVITLYR